MATVATRVCWTKVTTGIVFDVDGTLLDTNYLHVLAWWRAFREAGIQAEMATLHHLVGMGSDKLIQRVAGREREDVNEGHSRHYAELRREATAFPGAAPLLREVKRRGARVVLGTSAKAEELGEVRRALQADDAVDEIVSSADVSASKPAPDIFESALERAGLDARRALAVGDTVWDVESARRVGLGCVCVESGGIDRRLLEEAGALAVYRDVGELRERLDQSPLRELLPGS
jgi:HAD superfamily hydrolase (TIGR01509 family)